MEKTKKGLTYQEFQAFALQHYNEGGDRSYECCDETWFSDYVRQFGPMTKRKALQMFRIDKEISDMILSASW